MNIYEQLKAPFPADAVHWRVGATNAKKLGVKPWEATKGIALAYIDARDVMERLDEVVGAGNWQCRYPLASGNLLICELGIRSHFFDVTGDGMEWIWKANGAGETDVEADKGKCSDAFKRAAVLWGIGQYLYKLPNVWCDLKNGKLVNPPRLPQWALPEGVKLRKPATKSELKSAPKKPVGKLATDAQHLLIADYIEAGQIPTRTHEWYKKNKSTLTEKKAKDLIDICKKESEK